MEFEYQKVFTFDEKSYTIVFPTVGKMIEMETMKQALTVNKYGAMASSGVQSMYNILDLVDAIVFFKVNLPFFIRSVDVESYENMDILEAKKIVDVYKNQLRPWYENQLRGLYEISDNLNKNSQKDDK